VASFCVEILLQSIPPQTWLEAPAVSGAYVVFVSEVVVWEV
jgi:hypothetical protein